MTTNKNPVDEILLALKSRWDSYTSKGGAEQFMEFTLALNSLSEYFSRQRLPGLVRLCEELENDALTRMAGLQLHPMSAQEIRSLERQIDTLFAAVALARQPAPERRAEQVAITQADFGWLKPRSVWIINTERNEALAQALKLQLEFFGFQVTMLLWGNTQFPENVPLSSIFIATNESDDPEKLLYIATIRTRCPASQLVYLGAPRNIKPIVDLIRAGIDVTIPEAESAFGVLNCILDLVQTQEPEKSKVLIVEDSKVAVEVIKRSLAPHGIDTHAIHDPENLIAALDEYQPDLILMDMYMPSFNGVEATRVLRQLSTYSSIPVVYLSGETDIGMQVEALRLGGDQFLTKPFNPVLLSAIIKTKIERFRDTQRSTQIDGLTGLLNHTAAKSRLQLMMARNTVQDVISVAMLDIDHFKAINDTYGHPVGDQVIRGLAWLLKGRLRATDLIGRYGGEEFLIGLPGIPAEQAQAVINRIRQDFHDLPHAHQQGSLHASFSAGIATFPQFDTGNLMTAAADAALLEAKRLGRNRVEIATQ
jgi:diguanylate cyclase (GGDEF)-like protein